MKLCADIEKITNAPKPHRPPPDPCSMLIAALAIGWNVLGPR